MSNANATHVLAGAAHFKTRGGTQFRGGVFRSTLGDPQWQAMSAGLPENVEARLIVFHPRERGVVYAGTQDGPYRSKDGGEHWERLGFPVRGAVIWSMVFHPTRPKVMYAGTAPVGLYRSEDDGDTWTKLNAAVSPEHCKMDFPTRVTGIAVDPSRPDEIYAALEVSGVIRSSDGGDSWTDLSAPLIKLSEQPHLKSRLSSDTDASGMLDSHAIAVSAASPGNPFLAVRMGVFRSADRGVNWRDIEVGKHSPLTYCRDVIVSPHNANVLYGAFSTAARGQDGTLYRSDDLGASWRRFDNGTKANATMMEVSAHPHDPATVCGVSRCGQIFATADTGATWFESRLPADVNDVYSVACG